jgi:uridine phosphorylase
MKRYFAPSELLIEPNGAIYHLGVKPEQLADKVILVGDPGRVPLVASYFSEQECDIQHREFRTITGTYKGKRITVVSTGIGCDNVDIVVNEIDALTNIDFTTRYENDELRRLQMVRIGTCGGLQPHTPVGTFICSAKSVGFDGLLNYYAGRNDVCDLAIEKAFVEHTGWNPQCPAPYFIDADKSLFDHFADSVVEGITIAAPGFYGPQGRWVRIAPADLKLNEKIESFDYEGRRITNFEMESSALSGLSALMGHKAGTICTIIAQRAVKDMNTDYKPFVRQMVEMALDKLAEL